MVIIIFFFFFLLIVVNADKFCGVDLEDAETTCWQPCTSDGDCCALSMKCFETGSSCGSSDLSGSNHFFCGTR